MLFVILKLRKVENGLQTADIVLVLKNDWLWRKITFEVL